MMIDGIEPLLVIGAEDHLEKKKSCARREGAGLGDLVTRSDKTSLEGEVWVWNYYYR